MHGFSQLVLDPNQLEPNLNDEGSESMNTKKIDAA